MAQLIEANVVDERTKGKLLAALTLQKSLPEKRREHEADEVVQAERVGFRVEQFLGLHTAQEDGEDESPSSNLKRDVKDDSAE